MGSPELNQKPIFVSGLDGYHTYRIPATIVSQKGTILAFCDRILFSNPASINREKMTIKLSYDECQSWNDGKVLYQGPSGYSNLCVTPDMTICCLYERGEKDYRETITLARFNLDWLTDCGDQL